MDAVGLKNSFTQVAVNGDEAAQYFYSRLFVARPDLRDMFPTVMAGQRTKLVLALAYIVAHVDEVDRLRPFVAGLGRDHRRFGVTEAHFESVGQALLAMLARFVPDWSPALAAEWKAAYQAITGIMTEAAEQAGRSWPPWWDAEVVGHERRPGTQVAVLTLRPHTHLPYQPGQSVSVESHLRPRVWRWYSPACAPRADGTIELHVRAVPDGHISPALVHRLRVGDLLRLGHPTGTRLTLDAVDPGRDLLLIAGGTGLAPLRAIVEQLVADPHQRRQVTLIHGARTTADLYDLPALRSLAAAAPWLTLIPITIEGDADGTPGGTALDAVRSLGRPITDHEVLVCGPPGMVSTALDQLGRAGLDRSRIHTEELDAHAYLSPTQAGAVPHQPVPAGHITR
jgi:NAD(P)H-flavin reductase/hemoglobin-like flavoprotein